MSQRNRHQSAIPGRHGGRVRPRPLTLSQVRAYCVPEPRTFAPRAGALAGLAPIDASNDIRRPSRKLAGVDHGYRRSEPRSEPQKKKAGSHRALPSPVPLKTLVPAPVRRERPGGPPAKPATGCLPQPAQQQVRTDRPRDPDRDCSPPVSGARAAILGRGPAKPFNVASAHDVIQGYSRHAQDHRQRFWPP